MSRGPRKPRDPDDPLLDGAKARLGLESYERGKSFEEEVAELFVLQGYRAVVGYELDSRHFDIFLEHRLGALPIYALVECKDLSSNVTKETVQKLAFDVEYATRVDKRNYQAVLVARGGFADNAHETAENLRVHLQTYDQLLRSLVDLEASLKHAIRSFQGTELEKVYVEQEVAFERDNLVPQGLTPGILRWLSEPTGNFLALLGDFGCGKTSFLKRLACQLAQEAEERPAKGMIKTRIPVLIDLRKRVEPFTLAHLLAQHFGQISPLAFNLEAFLQLNRQGSLVLLVDGLDETISYSGTDSNLRQYFDEIFRAAEGSAKVILTCRTHYFRNRPEAMQWVEKTPDLGLTAEATWLYQQTRERAGTEVAYIKEFRTKQIEKYLAKVFPDRSQYNLLREQIRTKYHLENLAERPFLLDLIVKGLPLLVEHKEEVTLAALYEVHCQRWLDHTAGHLKLTREHKVEIVEYLARQIWDSPENRVHFKKLSEYVAAFFQDRRLADSDKERIDYEVRTALFLNRDAEGYYSFIHRSFLEFFIARTLRSGLAAGDASCLRMKRITREVVFFLEFWPEAKQIPEVAGRVLSGTYQPDLSENALLLLYFHTRAGFGPLAGTEADREPDLSRMREAFSRIRPETIQLPGAMLDGVALPGIDLAAADLRGAPLERADLRGASLMDARLDQANLRFGNFRQGSADGADLSGAELDYLDAQDASFRKATLRGADLSFARMTRADLEDADLREVKTVGTGFLRAKSVNPLVLGPASGNPEAPALKMAWLLGRVGIVNSVAWSPDGRCVATGEDNGKIGIWDAASGRLLNTISGHSASVQSVCWSPDGTRLASGSYDKTVKVWDATTGRLLNTLTGHDNYVLTVSWSADGTRLASGSNDNTVKVWEAASGRVLTTLTGHDYSANSVAWSPDGTRLASGSADQTVKVWDAATGRLLNTLRGHDNFVFSVSWSPDGTRLASGSADETVKVWDAATGRLLNTLSGYDDWVRSVSWSPDGTRLASGSFGQTVKVWDAATSRLLTTLRHDNLVLTVSWSPDGTRLASGSRDKTVKVWDAATGRLLNTLTGHDNLVFSVLWSPDGTRLASGSDDKTVKVWDAATGRLLNTLPHDNWVLTVSWSPDGTRLASGTPDKTVKVWDAATSRVVNTLTGHEYQVNSVAWSPDGTRLASGSRDKTVKVWDAASDRVLNTLTGHDDSVRSVSWSPDGTRLASGSYDWTVKLWDAATGRVLNTLAGHDDLIRSVSWSPDETRLASGSEDKTVKVWDATSGRVLNTLTGHDDWVQSVAWSPDGTRLASGSSDKTVKLWDAATGRVLTTLAGHNNSVLTVSWSPDGTRLAVGFRDGVLEIWDFAGSKPQVLARFYNLPGGSGFAATPDGYVSGSPDALAQVRFRDNWALYDITDLPERVSPERVKAALRRSEG